MAALASSLHFSPHVAAQSRIDLQPAGSCLMGEKADGTRIALEQQRLGGVEPGDDLRHRHGCRQVRHGGCPGGVQVAGEGVEGAGEVLGVVGK